MKLDFVFFLVLYNVEVLPEAAIYAVQLSNLKMRRFLSLLSFVP